MCRSAARKVRERSKEKKESGHFQMDSGRRSLQTYDFISGITNRTGRRETGRRSATATGTSAGMAADLVASRRIRHEPVHAGVVGQVAHHDRIGPYGGSLSCVPCRCTPVRRPHSGNRNSRPHVSHGNVDRAACTRRIRPAMSSLSARPSSRRLPPATFRRYAPTGGWPPRAGQPARRETQ